MHAGLARIDPTLPAEIARRFEALVFDWDGTAVTDRRADAGPVRTAIEALCAAGVHVAVVSGTHVGNVDSQLRARPDGPGTLWYALNRGSELFRVDRDGPRLVEFREATDDEDRALSLAAEATVARLAARGVQAAIVTQRLNRRKVDLIPEPEWHDPPKADIDRLLLAVEQRLRRGGLAGLAAAADLALAAARDVGLDDARVTSDAKHLEIGLTDKTHSAAALFARLWGLGVAPELVLIAGDELGPMGGMPGSDSLMLVDASEGATVCSVGVEPRGVPDGVIRIDGGPAAFLGVLHDQLARRGEVPRIGVRTGWAFGLAGVDPANEHARSALLTIADGVVGTAGAPLLDHPAAAPEVVVAGVYDGDGSGADLVPAPRWDRLDGALAPGDRVHRCLNLHAGVLGEWVEGKAELRSMRFASLARPGTVVLRVDAPELAGATPLREPEAPIVTRGHNGHEWIAVHGSSGSITAAAADRAHGTHLDRLAVYGGSPDGPQPVPVVTALDGAVAAGFDVLLSEHRAAWGRRWEASDVAIEGDDHLQLAVRLALFHLMASVADGGEAAVGARGLTGRAYRGHVFWDADTFVLPFLVATHAPAARAMLEYRLRRLPAARRAAELEGRRGARFPWESAASGFDVTPRAGRDLSGQVTPIRTGDAEVHIVGQVAWAAACYADWTADDAFIHTGGRELIVETARYWASRARRGGDGRAHLYGVIGPDEYHEPVDDNAFTNVLARWNLRRAASWPGAEELAPAEERAEWRALADALVDGYDAISGIYEQFGGFFGLEPLRIADVARRPVTADLLIGRDRVRAAQVVKQADVLMLHHLLPGEVVPGSLEANLDFYEPRTAHGSSLSPGVHAAVFARARRTDDAVAALRMAADIDLEDLTHTGAGGVHLAAMGSVWQALAFGFAGMSPHGEHLTLDPVLPPEWPALTLRVCHRGVPLVVTIEPDGVRVRAGRAVTVLVRGEPVECAAGMNHIPLDDVR